MFSDILLTVLLVYIFVSRLIRMVQLREDMTHAILLNNDMSKQGIYV